jgi:hypothetical protein
MKKWIGCMAASLFALGCSKPTYYFYDVTPLPVHQQTFRVKDVVTGRHGSNTSELDVLWLVGAMTEQAQNFQNGITTYMNGFVAGSSNWRMAIISNDSSEAPFLGMPTLFDSSSANPVTTFVNAAMTALNGNDAEQLFDPVYVFLKNYPMFLRPNAGLVVIISNDAGDSSTQMTTAAQMEQFLFGLKGDPSNVAVYGVLGADDLACDGSQIDGGWNYHGSQIEALINATGGQNYSLCGTNFGSSLAGISTSLANRFENHMYTQTLYLGEVVNPASVTVTMNGNVLPEGPQAGGGVWSFDSTVNAVTFYNMNFATDDIDDVVVSYTR